MRGACRYRDEEHRQRSLGSYQAERRFYEHVAPVLHGRGLPLPRLHATAWSADCVRGVVVMDDLSCPPGLKGASGAADPPADPAHRQTQRRGPPPPGKRSPRLLHSCCTCHCHCPARGHAARPLNLPSRATAFSNRRPPHAAPPAVAHPRAVTCCAERRASHGRSPLQRLALGLEETQQALAWLAAFHAACWVPPGDEPAPAAALSVQAAAERHLWRHGAHPPPRVLSAVDGASARHAARPGAAAVGAQAATGASTSGARTCRGWFTSGSAGAPRCCPTAATRP